MSDIGGPVPTLSRHLKLATTFCFIAFGAASFAQQQGKPPAYQDPGFQNQGPAQPPMQPDQQSYSPDWMPQGMSALAQEASWHTDFTFDRSMLALAGNLYGLDAPTRQSLARLNGITVHSYRFGSRSYDPSVLDAVRAQYNAMGWRHVVSSKSHGQASAPGYASGQTDLWIQTKGMNVAGGAVLLAGQSNVNLIAISGDLSTVDLLRLRGHFGIPKFSDNDFPPMH
jgi:hypothetical protein